MLDLLDRSRTKPNSDVFQDDLSKIETSEYLDNKIHKKPGGKQNEMEPWTRLSWRYTSRPSFCPSCLRGLRQRSIQHASRLSRANRGYRHIAKPGEQASPLTGYYTVSIAQAIQKVQPSTLSEAEQKEKDRKEREAKAQLVFGSRLAGPLEHKAAKQRQSTNIAGVVVPPKPEEPDNCCMSGCANCVWDLFREDLEEWALKASEAQAKLQAQGREGTADEHRLKTFTGGAIKDTGLPGGAASMDDDGGGSETNWDLDLGKSKSTDAQEDLFAAIPVGIREYMKTEKMLKERHAQERRAG